MPSAPGLAQQLLDDPLGFVVSALAEVVVADPALVVGDVQRRPVVVGERVPHRVAGVERDRILDIHGAHGRAHVVHVAFERELGRVDPDHGQPVLAVPLGPGPDVGRACAAS